MQPSNDERSAVGELNRAPLQASPGEYRIVETDRAWGAHGCSGLYTSSSIAYAMILACEIFLCRRES